MYSIYLNCKVSGSVARILEKYTDKDLSPANPVFKIHNYADNFEDIFELTHYDMN